MMSSIVSYAERWANTQTTARRRRQRSAVRGDEALIAFGRHVESYATDLILAQLDAGNAEAAFRTLEESRAQALFQLVAERETILRTDPELERALALAESDYRRAARRLSAAGSRESKLAAPTITPARISGERSDTSAALNWALTMNALNKPIAA